MKIQHFYALLITLISFVSVNAQYFTGKVYNEYNQALADANVYVDATNIGVVTNSNGEFKIEIPKIDNALLVISFMGYEKLYISDFSKNNLTYTLQPKENELEEVMITDSSFSRADLLKVFKREFLGENHKKCNIINEDAIRIKFDDNSNSISAFSNEDLIIINKKLNYKIRFNLIDFEAQLSFKDLAPQYLKQSFFYGTSFFEDHEEMKKKHIKRRKKAYLGSIQHFFKSLYFNKVEENEFAVFKNSFQVPSKSILKVEKQNSNSFLKLGESDAQKNADFYERTGKEVPYFFRVSLLYKKEQTDIRFTSNSIQFDKYGNYFPVQDVLLIGEMAKNKLGGMLPSNYEL